MSEEKWLTLKLTPNPKLESVEAAVRTWVESMHYDILERVPPIRNASGEPVTWYARRIVLTWHRVTWYWQDTVQLYLGRDYASAAHGMLAEALAFGMHDPMTYHYWRLLQEELKRNARE